MAFHHVAIATSNLDAAHRFYTEAMGFRLVHVEAGDAPEGDAWFRHVFYDTGDGSLLALFELHGDRYVGMDLRHLARPRPAELGKPHRIWRRRPG